MSAGRLVRTPTHAGGTHQPRHGIFFVRPRKPSDQNTCARIACPAISAFALRQNIFHLITRRCRAARMPAHCSTVCTLALPQDFRSKRIANVLFGPLVAEPATFLPKAGTLRTCSSLHPWRLGGTSPWSQRLSSLETQGAERIFRPTATLPSQPVPLGFGQYFRP